METYTHLNLFRLSIFGFLFLFLSGNARAQFSEEFNSYKQAHPNASMVRLNNETAITMKINKGNIDIVREIMEEDLYLNESATYGSKQSLKFSSFLELEKVEASSFVFENNKYREVKVVNFTEKDELENSFHDDTKSLNFIYPNLQKGGKSKIKYSEKIKNPRFLGPFFFADFFPVSRNKISINASKDISLRFQEINMDQVEVAYTETEKGANRIYTWEILNTEEYEYEENAPDFKGVLPHIIPIITSFNVNGTSVKVLNDVSDLYGWYYSLVKDINKEPSDPELVTLVEELTAGKEDDLEKVKAIYYWTQQNIKYIAFEYALGGFIPREANTVFRNKYGDCKDNSSILYQMLSLAGLKGNLTWIGTRTIPYTYSQVPTPLVDNHMILSYTYKDKTYFLDATGRYLPIDLPSSFIQGKEALIGEGDGKFRIEKVPVIPAIENSVYDHNEVKIVDGHLIGSAKTEVKGYFKIDLFQLLENLSTETKVREFYNHQFGKGSNKFLINDFSEKNKYDYEKVFEVDYTFSINNYPQIVGKEMYVNLNLNKVLSDFKSPDDRLNGVEYDYQPYYNFTTVFQIPEGYAVDYLPENVAFEGEHLQGHISYTLDGDMITYNHSLEIKFLNISQLEQLELNKVIKKAEKAYKESVVLKKL